ncbi:tRNA(His) guanylyltransferase Thg1 family protein [Pseudobacteriovorax antillogorgiicola]|uniref:tRNA(His) guanylyltransferase n=1 Tax=Pseudobacteriovorax antillogorgiicola TaxID=1513793 RepID=A0A1Y6CRQ1_9BACT|nr:tRNA(His) guanylyltransferase Thg1 family protein [Pseudobacteriovorax antillogorgiicola]TCS46368.1 tRNA(His) 5'-end guanylyltransferase [Pseudobacteriovorax antillogorgiicola]SMF68506.1 tRNA(His)-5'-guanylyltransferase [Pseudobacteriovorax antillogorgiicola]
MKFTDLDRHMRIYETAHDHCALPGIYLVARIDGRCFSRLTKEIHDFKAPYDERFRDYMIETIEHLMQCGFRVIFAYSQSDEINLLMHPQESSFSRKLRKYNSVLAAEASARFSLSFGHLATFDCRISQLPQVDDVIRYFRWRQDDAHRNALNGHCYWFHRKQGLSDQEAHQKLMGVSNSEKNEFLFTEAGINFNEIPTWERRGFSLYWQDQVRLGTNPKTGESQESKRQVLKVDLELPMKHGFELMVRNILEAQL